MSAAKEQLEDLIEDCIDAWLLEPTDTNRDAVARIVTEQADRLPYFQWLEWCELWTDEAHALRTAALEGRDA